MLYYTHNVVGTVNLIEAMRKHGITNVRPACLSLPSFMTRPYDAVPQLADLGATAHCTQLCCEASHMLPAWSPFRLSSRPAISHCVPLEAQHEQLGLCASPCRYLLAVMLHLKDLVSPLRQPSSCPSCPAYGVQQQSPRQTCAADGVQLQWHCRGPALATNANQLEYDLPCRWCSAAAAQCMATPTTPPLMRSTPCTLSAPMGAASSSLRTCSGT